MNDYKFEKVTETHEKAIDEYIRKSRSWFGFTMGSLSKAREYVSGIAVHRISSSYLFAYPIDREIMYLFIFEEETYDFSGHENGIYHFKLMQRDVEQEKRKRMIKAFRKAIQVCGLEGGGEIFGKIDPAKLIVE